jgi:uncharacterized protein (DUF1501 family)
MQNHLSTRRVFLQRGLTLLAATPTIPAFLDQTVMAIANPLDAPRVQRPSGKDGKILVVVQLSGGNDGLSTVVPFADDTYHKVRPGIRHDPKTLHKLTESIGLHPNLRPLFDMFQDGKLALVQGVGYPNPNRSHFRSMDIWQSAQPEREQPTSGWVGRFFDNACAGAPAGAPVASNAPDPHAGINIGPTLPLAMQGERAMPLSLERPEAYRYRGPDRKRYEVLNGIGGSADAHASPKASANSTLDFLHRTALDAQVSSDDILRVTQNYQPAGVTYPKGDIGEGLRLVAAMIRGGLSTRVYYVSLGGFDTHANERGRHDQLMGRFAEAVGAFWKDLAGQKNDERVLMMTFSEFGRRVAQNASGGTDHGTAAPMFLMGPGVKGGIVGEHPSLTDLDHGDLKYRMDFRSVYASVLQGWLDTPSKAILGKQFELAPVLKV